MTDQCASCQFWEREKPGTPNELNYESHGWCRRKPPVIVDHMARMAIRSPGFGGNVIDPEDVANCSTVSKASLFPATFGNEWCGEFQESAP